MAVKKGLAVTDTPTVEPGGRVAGRVMSSSVRPNEPELASIPVISSGTDPVFVISKKARLRLSSNIMMFCTVNEQEPELELEPELEPELEVVELEVVELELEVELEPDDELEPELELDLEEELEPEEDDPDEEDFDDEEEVVEELELWLEEEEEEDELEDDELEDDEEDEPPPPPPLLGGGPTIGPPIPLMLVYLFGGPGGI